MKVLIRIVDALRNAEMPKDKSELRSFLGMMNFCENDIISQLDVSWEWTQKEEKTFNILRNKLCEMSVLNYYDEHSYCL